jgi:crotonobetainyl-CoA:carnitine CoA-transferase CaiB-like acyl-CoA transferase
MHGATNRGKRSLTVDLRRPEGREIVLDLVRVSDAVIENFSPRVLPALGLGFDDLVAVNPRVVLVSLSAYGATGPESGYVAYGDHLTYASGLAAVIGHPDDGPTPINVFFGDPVGGMHGALGVVSALEERDRTGRGRHLQYSQVEGLVATFPGHLARRDAGEEVPRLVDKSTTMAPHGYYRCAGDDTWVAIAVEDDERWARLRDIVRRSGVAVADLATVSARLAAQEELDAAVSEWTASRSPSEVTKTCQQAGIAAFPMMDAASLIRDSHLHARGFFNWVDHPVTGSWPIPGVVFRMGDDGARVRGHAPLMGQHNEEVLIDLLGMSRERYDELVADGVIH